MKLFLFTAILFVAAIPTAAQTRTDDDKPLPEGAIARVGSTRFRTDGSFADFAFSPDGKLIAGASYGRRFSVWEVASGREVRTIRSAKSGSFGRVQFTSDGTHLVLGRSVESLGQAVCCYETRSGRLLFPVGDDFFQVDWGPAWQPLNHQWRIGPNDTLWVQGSAGPGLRELRSFDLPGGRETSCTRVPGGATLLDWTPNGTQLLLKGGGRLALHDVKTGKTTWELDVGDRKDVACGLTPDGKRIVTRDGNRLRAHDVASGRATADVQLPDGDWDPDTGLLLPHPRYSVSNSESKKGPREYTVVDLDRGRVCLSLPAYAAHSLAVSADGRFLTAHAGAGTAVWDLTRASPDPVIQLPGASTVRFSPDGRTLAQDGFGC